MCIRDRAGAWFGWTLLTEGGTVLLGIHLTGLPLSALFTMGYEWMSAFAALLFLAYNGARGGGGRPVSYTHLDVYKRQGRHTGISNCCL